jgi:hypothetical protein
MEDAEMIKYKATSKKIGIDSPAWDKTGLHYHYKITVRVGKKSTAFDFWGSSNDTEKQQESSVKDALYSWASDALAGRDTFENFCSEFGYSTDSREAERTYNACVKAYKAATRLGFIDDDLYKLNIE